MIRITFSEYDIQKIKFLRYHDPRAKVRRRIEVLWLKSQGLPHHRIGQLAGVCPTTLRQFKHAIADCLAQTHTTHKHELDTLLTRNFQAFKKCQLVPI